MTVGIICLLEPIRYRATFMSKIPCKFWGWGRDPQYEGSGRSRGQIRKYKSGFLIAPHSDQSAISNRVRRTQQHYRQPAELV